jgi:acyl-CoA synthetase (AMP-forming)/AMP-acid ligase II
MSNRFSDLLAHAPEGIAVRVQGRSVTRGELLDASRVAARQLRALGLRRGDTIAVWLPDGLAWLQLLFAAADLGILMVPVSTRYKEVEALHVVETARPRMLFVPTRFLDFDYRGAAERICSASPFVEHVVELASLGDFLWAGEVGLANLAAGGEDSGEAGDLLCTFTTTGTTGRPKLAVHTQAGIAAHARNVAAATGMKEGDAVLCALPLYGVLGFAQVTAALAARAVCVLQPVFKAEEAAGSIERFGVTHFFGSDAMLDMVMQVPGRSFASLRRGGFAEFAGMGEQVISHAQQHLGLHLTGIYGMSECFALAAMRSPGDAPEVRAQAGGRPVADGIRFRVVDPDTGAEVADGGEGELQLRGYNVMVGYLNNPAATAEAFTPEGWLRTGDLARRQGDSFCYHARLRDSLRLRGYLVDPAEIEQFLGRHAQVAAAQVVGVSLPGEGDVAVAFVIPANPGQVPDLGVQLIAHCKAGIAGYKVPRRVFIVDRFPQIDGPNGIKVIKATLRDIARQALGQGVATSPKEPA